MNDGARKGRFAAGPDLLALALVGLAIWLLARVTAPYGFVGWDTYPTIASAKIDSWADLLGTFTEIAAEGYFPDRFYRPVFNLSLAADYAVWELDASGYLWTNLFLFAVCALGLYALARSLLRPVGALATLACFLLAPTNAAVVVGPFSRRGDLLAGLFVAASLAAQARLPARPGLRRAALPLALTVLAMASKEIAIVLPPLVFLLVLLTFPSARVGVRVDRALRASLAHLAAVLVVMIPRTIVVGGLGSHGGTRLTGVLDRGVDALGNLALQLTSIELESPVVLVPSPASTMGAVSVVALLAMGVAVPLWPSVRGVTSRSTPAAAIGVGAAWVVLCAGVYSVVGILPPWYLFVPSLGEALVFGGLTEGAALGLRRRGAMRTLRATAVGLLVIWLVWYGRASPLVDPGPLWSNWTRQSDAFLAQLSARLAQARSGDVVVVSPPAQVLRPHTLQAWADLTHPEPPVHVVSPGSPPGDEVERGIVVRLEPGRSGAARR